MKRLFFISVILLSLLVSFSLCEAKASKYTGFVWLDTDTVSDYVEADTLSWYDSHNWLPDSTHWGFIVSSDQANDSVDVKIDAFWCQDTTDTTTWTDAQAVIASHKILDWICTFYVPEHLSRMFRYYRLIITATADKNGKNTIIKTGIAYRKR